MFSPGRLRAHRDIAGLTRDQLADVSGLPVTVIVDYERGTQSPTEQNLTMVADALRLTPDAFTGPSGADESWEYWELVCAAMPPMSSERLDSVVTVLRRIDQRRHSQPPPDPHPTA